MTKVETYIFFNGNCAEAMKYYAKTLGGKIGMSMTGKQSPILDHLPPGSENKILHSRLDFDGGVLMASDWMDTSPYPAMKGFRVSISYPKVDQAKRVFDALSKGGKVDMPFGKTFWAESFGMLTDRFGTPWMVAGGGTPSA